MFSYILRRILQMIPTLAGVILLVFFLFKYFGDDPAEILGGLQATQEQIDSIRRQLGLDRPVWEQLWLFVQKVVTFNWGASWSTKETVANIFATRLPATLTIMIPILVLEVGLAIVAGMAVAYVRGSLTDRLVMIISTIALSISFLVYIIIGQYLFAFQLGWFPVQGWTGSTWTNLLVYAPLPVHAGGAGEPGAAHAPVPQLLPRRDRARLRAHRPRQGRAREDDPLQARAAQRDDPDPHQRRARSCPACSSGPS